MFGAFEKPVFTMWAVAAGCARQQPSCKPAALAGHLACCKLLLEEGADIEQRNVVGGGLPAVAPLIA